MTQFEEMIALLRSIDAKLDRIISAAGYGNVVRTIPPSQQTMHKCYHCDKQASVFVNGRVYCPDHAVGYLNPMTGTVAREE